MLGVLSGATAQLRVSSLMRLSWAPMGAHPTDPRWITRQLLLTQAQPASRSYTIWCEGPETWCLKGIHSLLMAIRRKCHLSGKQIILFSLASVCQPSAYLHLQDIQQRKETVPSPSKGCQLSISPTCISKDGILGCAEERILHFFQRASPVLSWVLKDLSLHPVIFQCLQL